MRKYIFLEIFLIILFLFLLFLGNLIFSFYVPEFRNINTGDPTTFNSTNYFLYKLYFDYFGAVYSIFNLIILPFIILFVIPFKLFHLWLGKYLSGEKVKEANSKLTQRLSRIDTQLKSRKKFALATILLIIPYIILMLIPGYEKLIRSFVPKDSFYVSIGLSGDKYKEKISYKPTPTIIPINTPAPTPTIAPYPSVTPAPYSYKFWPEYLNDAIPNEMKKYEQEDLHGLSFYAGADINPYQLEYTNSVSTYEKNIIYQLYKLESMEKTIAYYIYNIEDSDKKLLIFSTFSDEGKIGVHFVDKNGNIIKIASRFQSTGPYYVCGPDLYGKDNYLFISCTVGDGGGDKPYWFYKLNITTGEFTKIQYCSVGQNKTECEDL